MQSTTITQKSSTQRYSTEGDDVGSTYRPKSSMKSVIINRTGGGRSRSSMYGIGVGSGFSARTSMNINPAVYSQMAGTGIAGYRDTREKEKKEMQDCNERLATYIEKVRWLEAQNKKLEAEVEALRKRKQEDWRPIKDMFEGELNQARAVISELSTQKGIGEAKLAGLQDEIESLRNIIGTYEINAKDYAKKIDQLNSQIGEYEGELNTLRLRCGSLEDEAAKLRALVNKYKEENARLRADLDAETAAHIEQEVLAQTKTEECEFWQELVEKLQMTQQEPVLVKGLDMESFFKGELRQAIQGIQQTFDEQLEQATFDVESKYASQMNQIRSGNVRDTMEAEQSKAEVKRTKDMLAQKNARIAELEAEMARLMAERDEKARCLMELEHEFQSVRNDLDARLAQSKSEIEIMLAQIQELIDAKMSLEIEIACYKKLLEGEENRTGLRQLVEQSIGMRSGGAGGLSDLIGQSSMEGGGGFSGSSTSRMSVQKTRTGQLGIKEVDPSGGFIVLEMELGARPQKLKDLKLVKKVNGKETVKVDLSDYTLDGGQTFKVCAKGFKATSTNSNEQIVDQFSFGMGDGDIALMQGNKEIATAKVRQAY